jgi:hypothetical protein
MQFLKGVGFFANKETQQSYRLVDILSGAGD